jgi:hypothetical protein
MRVSFQRWTRTETLECASTLTVWLPRMTAETHPGRLDALIRIKASSILCVHGRDHAME